MDTLWQDLRYSWRGLRRQPGFVATVLCILALGISANTVIFSVVNAVILNPLSLSAWHDPDRVLMLWEKNSALTFMWANEMPVRPQNYRAWKEQAHSFSELAAWRDESVTLTDPDRHREKPEEVETGEATADLFPLLGVPPRFGRGFKVGDSEQGKNNVALLSDELYRSRFESNPLIVGATIFADGRPVRVIGVLPPGVAFPSFWGGLEQKKPQLWLPLDTHPAIHADQ